MKLFTKEDGYRRLIYSTPLKNCQNKKAQCVAELVEQLMWESLEMQADFINIKVKQIYDYMEKQIRELNNDTKD